MKFEFASALDTGRVRKNNEDAVALDAECGLAILADGMGGYNAGEVASGMASQIVRDGLAAWIRARATPPGPDELRRAMGDIVEQANRAIFDAATQEAQYAGMGTTLVMLALAGDGVLVGHIGDSRAYRLRARRIERLTRDHSLLQEQLDAGLITVAQAARSIHRNLVTRAMGVEPEVTMETHRHDLAEGDLLLLCSDGLTDMLDDSEIAELMGAAAPLQTLCESLVQAANQAGGKDNISVVLVRVGESAAAVERRWWSFWR